MLRNEDIYEEILRDHILYSNNKLNGSNKANQCASGSNVACGDCIKVNICNHNNVIQEISFTGNYCSTAKLSAILMIEELKGKTTQEAENLFNKVKAVATSEDDNEYKIDGLFPILIKQLSVISSGQHICQTTQCVLLPWQTMLGALEAEVIQDSPENNKDYSKYLY